MALPTVALLALAGVHGHTVGQHAADAARARVVVGSATAASALLHLLERELAETQALRGRGGDAGLALVAAARERTDDAVTAYQQATADVRGLASTLDEVLAEAGAAVGTIPAIRLDALGTPQQADTADDGYREVADALLAVAHELPAQLDEPSLAATARAMAALVGIEHAVAQQRDLVRAAIGRGALAAEQTATLAGLVALEEERLRQLRHSGDEQIQRWFTELVTGTDVTTARQLRDQALDPDSALPTDADAWYVAYSHTIRHLREVALRAADRLSERAASIQSGATQQIVTTLGVIVLFAAAAQAAAIVMAARTSRRLRLLHTRAIAAAETELPATVRRIAEASDPVAVRDRDLAALADQEAALHSGGDEIAQVSDAIAAVQRQAVQLAAEQALRRRDIATAFETMARRSQTLVGRQLQLLDQLEERERDPDQLEWLYRVDHLAARMRRNDDNLLVLAGGSPARRAQGVVDLADVVRAAAAEIEEYHRVQPAELPELGIVTAAAGDVIHLLAELLENAASFSAPDTTVSVTGYRHRHGLQLAVHDQGVGMHSRAVATANRTLAEPGPVDALTTGTMGLLVVSRLAARHGIGVQLQQRASAGITAQVELPATLLAQSRPTSLEDISRGPLIGPGSGRPAPAAGHVLTGHRRTADARDGAAVPARVAAPVAAALSAVIPAPAPPPDDAPVLPTRAAPPPPPTPSAAGPAPAPPAPATDRIGRDPEQVRRRLAGLSGGVAAARRDLAQHPGGQEGATA